MVYFLVEISFLDACMINGERATEVASNAIYDPLCICLIEDRAYWENTL